MGAADKVVDPDVEAALSAIRQAISNETPANKVMPKGVQSVSAREPLSDYLKPQTAGQRPGNGRTTTSPEEIVELRNRISGHLDRIAMPAKTQPEAPRSAHNGFADILGGETRLQDEPPPVAYDPPETSYGRDPYLDLQAAQWREEPPPYTPPLVTERAPQADAQSMLSSEASNATQAAFNQLAETLMNRAMGERSVEEVTRELLRTMLKRWLDENLPPLVERLVREEIERVARRGPQR